MTDHSSDHPTVDLTGSHRGHEPSDGRTDAENAGKFDPKVYFWGAWHLVKNDPFIFLWKLLLDAARAAVSMGTLIVIAAVLIVMFADAMGTPEGPLVGFQWFIETVASPQFLIGAVGLLFCAWLVSLVLDVLVLSGVWGTFAKGARGEDIQRFRTFFSNLTTRFPAVLSLRVTTLAAQGIVALLGIMVLLAIVLVTTGEGAFATSSAWVRGLLWATPLTFLALFGALVRLTMEVTAAPLILERRTLGDAIVTAAELVTRRFAEIYRLVIVAAGLMLVPLFFYWGVLIFQNLTLDVPELAPLVGLLRLLGEGFLFVATGAIAVMFYGALFVYYAHEMGMIDQIPSGGDDQGRRSSTGRPVAPAGGPNSGRVRFDRDTTLEELLPDGYPNIVSLDDILGARPTVEEPAPRPGRAGSEVSDETAEPDDGTAGDAISGDDIFDSDDESDT